MPIRSCAVPRSTSTQVGCRGSAQWWCSRMSEPAAAPIYRHADPAARLAGECARLGTRLALLLDNVPSEDARASAAAAFLRRTAASAPPPVEPAADDAFELLT